MNDDDLIACPECDALYHRIAINRGEKACCSRCGSVLYGHSRISLEQILALIITALICLVIANTFPIVSLSIQGLSSKTTLLDSVGILWGENSEIVATVVFLVAFLVPVLDLSALGLLVICALCKQRPVYYKPLLRLLLTVRPWGMIEILMLGILVSLVKLAGMASINPGPALWAFAALSVLLTIIVSWDPYVLWEEETKA